MGALIERARGALAGVAVATLAVAAAPAGAQEELVTDRPDQTESAAVVPQGTVQIESGALWTRSTGLLKTLELPATLLRVGLGRATELRLDWGGLVTVDGGSEGPADAGVGAKFLLAKERGRWPQMALLVASSLPTGEAPFSSRRFDPSLRLAVAREVVPGVGRGWNLGVGWESQEGAGGRRHALASGLYTIAAGRSLGGRWSGFVELFGELPLSAPGDPAHSFDAGLTCLVRPNLQLDLAAGVGLSSAADDAFAGLGLSVRLPD